MLEIANLYKGKQLENSIYLLFTDAEEIGGYGAEVVLQHEKDLMSKVGFVINMEVRGVSGAVYMFETSPNNKKVIEFYRKARYPVAYSLANTVYRKMNTYTDFSWFQYYKTSNGINFAAIDGVDHINTTLDNYQEVRTSTIQHYGEQITPLVEAFVTDPKYNDVHFFDATEDSVFFTLFPNVFVSYSATVAKILHFVVLIMLIAVAFIMVKKRGLQLPKLIMYAVGFLIAIILTAFVYGYLMALFGQVPYLLLYLRMNGSEWPTLLFMLAVTFVYIRYVLRIESVEKQQSFLLIGVMIQMLITLITGFALLGVSFFFFVPALLGTLALIASLQRRAIVKHITYGASILLINLLVVPILYSFYHAFLLNGTPVLVALLLFSMTVSLPVFKLQITMMDTSINEQTEGINPVADSQNSNTQTVKEQSSAVAEKKYYNYQLHEEMHRLAEDREKRIRQDRIKKLIRIVTVGSPIAIIIIGIILLVNLVITPATKYSKAQNQLTANKHREAFALLTEFGDYKDSEQIKERLKTDMLKNVKVGETIYWGQYNQDKQAGNGNEDILWRVLAVENGKVLIISEKSLDAHLYHEKKETITWESSSLRAWLNSEFLQTAFSTKEQEMIAETTLSNENNPQYGTKGGNQTIDKVFLLSAEEVNQYLTDKEFRKAQNTAYTSSLGIYGGLEYSWWWLRSPGYYDTFAVFVDENGNINEYGDGVSWFAKAIRPALWLNLP